MTTRLILTIAVLLTATSCYASDADITLGRQWAKCSQQAKILQKLTKDTEEAKTLKKAGALFRIYADAALGSSDSLVEREKTEAAFLHGISVDSKANSAAHLANFYKQAKADAEICSASLTQHGSKFEGEVDRLLKRSNTRTSSAGGKS